MKSVTLVKTVGFWTERIFKSFKNASSYLDAISLKSVFCNYKINDRKSVWYIKWTYGTSSIAFLIILSSMSKIKCSIHHEQNLMKFN